MLNDTNHITADATSFVGAGFSRDAPGFDVSAKSIAAEAASYGKSPAKPGLTKVLQHPGIWRRASAATAVDAQPSQLPELDARLPGGGWPRGALSEILIEEDGTGEFGLLAPVLATLTQAGKRVVLIAPPYVPYAPALTAAGIDLNQLVHIDAAALDTHWTAEQCLRSGCCAAVLNWLPQADYRQLRRLQLAAETGASLGFVFRPARVANQPSPAALRIHVRRDNEEAINPGSVNQGWGIEILKCRGGFSADHSTLRLRA